jgi:hypothetical protein
VGTDTTTVQPQDTTARDTSATDTTSIVAGDSTATDSTTVIHSTTVIRDIRRARPADMRGATHKEYRDLKGRRFDRQIPYRVMF